MASTWGLPQGSHRKGRLSPASQDNLPAVDTMLFPRLSPTLLTPTSSLNAVMSVFSRWVINISDLLFPHSNADGIYSSDPT